MLQLSMSRDMFERFLLQFFRADLKPLNFMEIVLLAEPTVGEESQ